MRRIERLKAALVAEGLAMRGSFVTTGADKVPALNVKSSSATLVMVGNTGPSLWASFSSSLEYKDGKTHSLDRWSQRIGDRLASEFAGLALYPFDGPPFWPFLTWTQKAEGLIPSPLGLNLHPHFGLWHAYRFALLVPFIEPEIADENSNTAPALDCTNCIEQPCLYSCPVNAFDGKSYNTDNCANYLNGNPDAHCNSHGCLARHACPVGQQFSYKPEQAHFHMQAFIAARNSH